jgi:hypothetical protein
MPAVLRIRVVYPGSGYFIHPGSWITDLTTKDEGAKICRLAFFCSHKFQNKNYFTAEQVKKKFEPIYKE